MSHVMIIAEAGVNHNGDLNLAKKLVDAAVAAGADFIKFQTFKAKNLVTKAARKADYQITNTGEDGGQFEMIRKLELDEAAHHTLIDYCHTQGIRFFSTAFDLESIELLAKLGLDLFKIPSGELTNLPYLRKVATYGLPVILSTGMAEMHEIEEAIRVLTDGGVARENLTILHCNTEYPTPMHDVNLRAMRTIADTFGVQVGYSDHTLGVEVPIAAVAMGAVCIEKHMTLDRSLPGPDHAASLEPDEFKHLVSAIRNIEAALGGDGLKTPSASEQKNMVIARKSIHIRHDLPAGHVLTEDDLVMKRPGDGISPMRMDDVLGHKLAQAVSAEHQLAWADLEGVTQ